VYLSLQGVLVASASARPDHAFGFRMFSESSVVKLSLLREVDAPTGQGTVVVPAARGEWSAMDADGTRRHFAFRDRVREPWLSTFDATFEASYGAGAELARLQAALDDVASHLDGDAETRRLVLDVIARRNGREPQLVRLTSPSRTP
jgi:hypothetical protein